MSMSLWSSVCQDRQREAYRRGGPEEAERDYHSQVGGVIGFHAGMASGAAIGSMILPGVGTVVGGLVGMTVGFFAGSEDQTGADNLKRLGKAAASIAGDVRKLR